MRLRSQITSEAPVQSTGPTRSTRRRGQQKENLPVTTHQRTKSTKLRKAPPTRKAPTKSGRSAQALEPTVDSESEVEVESALGPLDDDEPLNTAISSPHVEPLANSQSSLPPSSDIPKTIPSDDQDQGPRPQDHRHVPSSPWSGPKFDASQSELGDYMDEPSRQPDPSDPFGFLAAERQLKLRRDALKGRASGNKAELSFEEEAVVAAQLEWEVEEDDDEDEEEAPRAFATPKRSRVSRLRRSTRRPSLQSLSEVPSSSVIVLEATPRRPESPRLTTMELEELLPKRRPAKKFPKLGQRAAANKERKVSNRKNDARVSRNDCDSEDEAREVTSKKSRRPRRGAKKEKIESEDEREEIDLDMDEKNFKAREDRKKALGELDNYKFETEMEIWL
ncbi:hypothetical protein FRC04_004584 [Tulasnella sp. 424]|nr:hypothetical protein FRC04_004584 [Tulasnella sp. 424]KAG8976653.1 hypothetical protein FRC05_003492 [Tulasnella sp. 425]